jgi:hypothetical protein
MLARMKADRLCMISAGGVQFGPTSRNVFVVDPNGMNLKLTDAGTVEGDAVTSTTRAT